MGFYKLGEEVWGEQSLGVWLERAWSVRSSQYYGNYSLGEPTSFQDTQVYPNKVLPQGFPKEILDWKSGNFGPGWCDYENMQWLSYNFAHWVLGNFMRSVFFFKKIIILLSEISYSSQLLHGSPYIISLIQTISSLFICILLISFFPSFSGLDIKRKT